MPLTLTDLRRKRRPLKLEWEVEEGGEKTPLNLVYTPSGYNGQMEAEIRAARNDNLKQAELTCKMLVGLLVEWDLEETYVLTDGEGQPLLDKKNEPKTATRVYPISEENLMVLGHDFNNFVLGGIIGDMRPGEV